MRAHHEGRIHRHQSDWPQPDNPHAAARLDLGPARAVPCGGQRVGHHQGLIVGDPIGDQDCVHIGRGNTEQFGLNPLQPGRQAIAGPRPELAIGDIARQARTAGPATDCGGHHHFVADLDPGDAAPNFDHLTHRFVPDAKTDVFAEPVAVVNVQIAAADRATGHLHHGIAIALDLRISHRLVANIARRVVSQRLHSVSPPSTTMVCPVT